MNVYAKFRCAPLHIKKALGLFTELITTTRTTRDPPSRSKKVRIALNNLRAAGHQLPYGITVLPAT